MSNQITTYIPAESQIPEITCKVVIIAIFLALLLAASNTFLALKIGLLTSASIPAAILSMGILRFFKSANILENNLIQTAASAGEAVAGGIVYTIPALIILHYWHYFPYWENVAIALTGGVLGVLFSVPIRRILVTEKTLPFPEGQAIAEVLKAGDKHGVGIREILMGGLVGAVLEFAQMGLQVIANSFQVWFVAGRSLVGFGAGFSATLVGAGYLIGFGVGISLLMGAVVGWLVGVPILTWWQHVTVANNDVTQTVMTYWSSQIRYVGVGAMLTAGVWTLLTLLKPFYDSLRLSFYALSEQSNAGMLPRTERDLPINYVILAIIGTLVLTYFLFQQVFLLDAMGLATSLHVPFLLASVLYVLILGFIFAAICGYFSGLVGVTASPGSAVIIGGLFFAALLIRLLLSIEHVDLSQHQLLTAAAVTVIIGAVITGAACIANDNIQDLKVGHLLGATPWKQQVMLLLGVIIAALIIPPIMQVLFDVYGIADVLPRVGMDPSKTLAAPPAAMMALVTQAVFHHALPWNMVLLGMLIVVMAIIINQVLDRFFQIKLSILGMAVGIYLPLTSTIPLFFGSVIALMTQRKIARSKTLANVANLQQRGIITACGLVAGAALMDVLLAIPFALSQNSNILKILPDHLHWLATSLGWLTLPILGYWLYRLVVKQA